MPFKERNKIPVWEPPTKEDTDSFIKNLTSLKDSSKSFSLPDAVQKQFDSFMISTFNGGKRLADSNIKLKTSLKEVAQTGLQPVDIILPVYDGVYILEPCLKALAKNTHWPYTLTIVNDASPDVLTTQYLEDLKNKTGISVLTNKKNKGFSASVNRGVNSTENPYVCVLNSDVLVTDGWLTKMVLALESDERNKIVNPCTNNTALINVEMQEGFSYKDMNRALELSSSRLYPEIMPTGFCFMFYRSLVDELGMFDEGFDSYGEETDFWMRVISHVRGGEYPRWKAVLADDAYLFHERGSSFSALGNQEHMGKRQTGSARFHSIWPSYKQWSRTFDVKAIMAPIRAKLPDSMKETKKYNVTFVVYHAGYCGGMSVITDLVNEYIERDVNATVCLIKRNKDQKTGYMGELRTAPIVFESPKDFVDTFSDRVFNKGIVFAATNELVQPVADLCAGSPDLIPCLFSQSYDVELSPPERLEEIKASYGKISNAICASSWVAKIIEEEHNIKPFGVIKPGVTPKIFHPRDRKKGDDRPTLMIPLINSYPFKGYDRGVNLAKHFLSICRRNKKEVRVFAYGVNNVPECSGIIGLGDVSQTRLANLLSNEVDIFCDPSYIHSYGLPSLEALASGASVVSWDNKGIREYSDDAVKIFPYDAEPTILANYIYNNLFKGEKDVFSRERPVTIQRREDAVESFIDLVENKFSLKNDSKSISIITPHLRKHGGPSTILHLANGLKNKGHSVDLYTVYPDINPEVLEPCQVPIHLDWKNVKECDILISNSDNEHNNFFVSQEQVKHKIMLKLSHNPRFQALEDQSLHLPWDAIVTSTDWLVDVCKNPRVDEGWTHGPKDATRIGWFHYGHELFNCPPTSRKYGAIESGIPIRIGFLAHQHPLKGTKEALRALGFIKEKYKDRVAIVGIGEWPDFKKQKPEWCAYAFSQSRTQMATLMQSVDIWLGASYTEGLGRLALEAMSSGAAVIVTDTGAEFAEDKKNCLVVGRGNTASMVKAIDNLISDKVLFSEIAKKGYETACSYANDNAYIDVLNEVIQNVGN